MDVLYADEPAGAALPNEIRAAYGGDLWLERDCVYANVVTSLDGVVATDPAKGPGDISGHHPADRLVMGLLRAFADCVLIGGGTLRAEPNHQWTPAYIAPGFESSWVQIRRDRGLAPEPLLAVATRSVTTRRSAVTVGGSPHEIVHTLRDAGCRSILCEAGPGLFTQLVQAGLVDELFLTLAPTLAGTAPPHLTLGHGARLDPRAHRLRSVRRDGSHLLLRYGLTQ